MLDSADRLHRRLLKSGGSYSGLAGLSVKHFITGLLCREQSAKSHQAQDGLPGCNSLIASLGSALEVILRALFSFEVSVRSILPPESPLLLLPKLRMDFDRGRCPDLEGIVKVEGGEDCQASVQADVTNSSEDRCC